jgi:serine protease AprX
MHEPTSERSSNPNSRDTLRTAPRRPSGQQVLGVLLGLTLLVGGLPSAALADRPQGKAHVDSLVLQKAVQNPNAMVPVLIHRTDPRAAVDAVRQHGGSVKRELKTAHAVAAKVPLSALDALAKEPGVSHISYDVPLRVVDNAHDAGGDRGSRGNGVGLDLSRLQTAYPFAVDSASLWNGSAPLQGSGVTVAVLDSGINDKLPDFQTSCRGGQSRVLQKVAVAVDDHGGPEDDNGHGTWVAGIIGGRGCGDPHGRSDHGDYVGIAPSANLIGIKVSDKYGQAAASDVVAGIEWAVDHKDQFNIRVLNLSLVSSVAQSYRTSLLDAAVELAWLRGLVVVVAAGNTGPNSVGAAPANDPYAIAVGATDDQGTRSTTDDSLAWFSSYGTTSDGFSKPDLVAPGRHIVSTLASPQIALAQEFPTKVLDNGYYIRLSGTSASAPVVSGLVAQLLQARPSLTPGQVRWLLLKTAQPVPGVGTGAGYPDAAAAVRYNGSLGNSNSGLVPNNYVAQAYARTHGAVAWDAVGWDAVGWDAVGWDAVGWDAVGWDAVGWDAVGWDAVGWDAVGWDAVAGD